MVAATATTRAVVVESSPRRTVRAVTRDRLPLLIVLLALLLFVPGMWWGIPHATAVDRTHAWGNDDLVPLAPLAEMYNTFVNVEPRRNVAYPWFQYFLDAAVTAPYLAYLKFSGQMEAASPAFPFGLKQPEVVFRRMTWFGRSISLFLAIAVPIGMYFAGKYLWGRRAGFAAAIFALLMFPLAYYARIGNVDAPVLGWTSLGIAAFALILRSGLTPKRAAAFSTFVALAIATKDQAAGSFIFLVGALLLIQLARLPRVGWTSGAVWRSLFVMGGVFAAVYLTASGAFIDWERFVQHTSKIVGVGTGSIPLYNRFPATVAGYWEHFTRLMAFVVDVLSWPVVLLSLVGVVLAALRDRRSLLLLLSTLGFLAILMPVRLGRLHYLLPVALPLTLFAGYAVHTLYERGGLARRAVLVFAAGAAGFLLLQSIDLTHDMIKDSRYAAGDWMDQNTRAGDVVVYFGAGLKNPRMRADVASIMVDYRKDALPTITSKRPEVILVSPEDTNEDRMRVNWRSGPHSVYSDYLPADVYAGLADGSLGYRLVAQFQSPRLMPWLPRPFLTFATVNMPVQIFVREDRAGNAPRLQAWQTAPHYPKPRKSYEPKYAGENR